MRVDERCNLRCERHAERTRRLRVLARHELAMLSAEDRLASFLEQFPGLAARISQKDLACYLGMTPVSLSRIRGRARRDAKA